MKQIFTIQPEAVLWLKEKLGDTPRVVVSLNKKGCAGGEYVFEPLAENAVTAVLDSVTQDGVAVYFARSLTLALIGAELLVRKDGFNTRLDFNNPNEKARCGCGESVAL